jgi:hypothetical protein
MMAGFAVCVAGTAAAEQAPKKGEEMAYDVNTLTCKEFAALSAPNQAGFIAFVEGAQRAKRKPGELGDLEVGRSAAPLAQSCEKSPQTLVKDALKGKLPAGKRKLKPGVISCQAFAALLASDQRELAAFADGYYDSNRVNPGLKYEADYENDVAQLLGPCKAAPKASFWEEIQKLFRSEERE